MQVSAASASGRRLLSRQTALFLSWGLRVPRVACRVPRKESLQPQGQLSSTLAVCLILAFQARHWCSLLCSRAVLIWKCPLLTVQFLVGCYDCCSEAGGGTPPRAVIRGQSGGTENLCLDFYSGLCPENILCLMNFYEYFINYLCEFQS